MLRSALSRLTLCACIGAPAWAEAPNLALVEVLDVSALPLGSIGDLAFERSTGRLLLVDGSIGGQGYVVSPSTGALQSTFSPAAIPGLSLGPDALAIRQAPTIDDDVYVFSSFGESKGGRVALPSTLVVDYGTSHGATGADTNAAGDLWLSTGTTALGGSSLVRISTNAGSVLATVPILGVTQRTVDIAFDPFTGALFALSENGILREIDLATGVTVSSVDLGPFLLTSNTVTGGITFNNTGTELFVATGTGASADSILVFSRVFSTNVCDSGDALYPCPCSNPGAPGRGCENSFTTGGGLLSTGGVPSVSDDSLSLFAVHLPPTTSCLFFQGTAQPESGPPPFGDGLRCAVGVVIRLGTKTTNGGLASYGGGSDVPIHVRGAIPALGATRFYQHLGFIRLGDDQRRLIRAF